MSVAIAGFVTRAEADLRPPRSRSYNIEPERGGTTGHYAGGEQNVSPLLRGHTRCINLWKAYQDYHMDTRHWVDIAYTGGFCDHGYAFAGRGANVRTAANGTANGNQYFYAVVWIGGGSERPTKLALDALRWWVATLRADGNAGMRAVPHSFHKNTACPGSYLRSELATMDNRELEEDLVGWSDWVPQRIRDWAEGHNITTEHTRHRDPITAEQTVVMLYRAIHGTGVEEGANHALNLKQQMKSVDSSPGWVAAAIKLVRAHRRNGEWGQRVASLEASAHDHPDEPDEPTDGGWDETRVAALEEAHNRHRHDEGDTGPPTVTV